MVDLVLLIVELLCVWCFVISVNRPPLCVMVTFPLCDASLPPPQMCTDCPATLIPYHVKPEPALACKTVSFLPGNASFSTAWDEEMCPDWCLATDPVGQTRTGSGFVDIRTCGVASGLP